MIKTKWAVKAIFTFVVMCLSILTFNGCSVLDRVEPTPAYLFIDSFTVTTNSDNSQGSNANEIVDGWVYVGGTLIGVFELPAIIPVIYEKSANEIQQFITVLPGIKNNGLSNSRVVYPFYKGYIDSVNLTPGKIDTLIPVTSYQSTTKFTWLEDFEDRSISLEKSGINVTEDSIQLRTNPDEIYNDGKNKISAMVELEPGVQYFENSSITKFTLPRNSAVYLEINYKLDVNMQVGFYAYNSEGEIFDQVPLVELFSTNGDWKKTYISLAEDINSTRYANAEFKIFFAARSTNTSQSSKIYFDNIKLLNF